MPLHPVTTAKLPIPSFFTAYRRAPYTAIEENLRTSRAISLHLRTVAALWLALLLCGNMCPAQEVAPKPTEKPTEAQKEKPPATAPPELPAQIELLETRVRFEANGDSRKEVHTRVHINSELGVRQFARLNFDYNRAFEAIEIPLVRITHSSGGTADILPSAITDNPNPAVVNAPAYQDVRIKSVRNLGLQPGDVLEYRVITTVSHHPLAPDFWFDHTFDRAGVALEQDFELDLPGHLNSTSRMQAGQSGPWTAVYFTIPATSFQASGEGKSARSTWQWKIPPTRILPAAIDDAGAAAPDLIVSSFWDWNRLVERLAPHFLNWSAEDSKTAEERLHSLAAGASAGKLLRAGYEFVSQKLATVDLPLGATGFQLRHVKEILDSGYATPEEKCLLLAEFSRIAGMKTEIVLVGAPETQKQFSRPSPFHHIFVIVSEKKRHLAFDPGLEVAPFGLIAPQFRGKAALSLTLSDAGDYMFANWAPLPAELPFPATQAVHIDAALGDDGKLTSKVHYALRGDNELLLRVAFHQSPKEGWKELAQLLSISDGFRGQVTSVTASDPYATRDPFTLEYEITQPKFVDWSKKPVRVPALLPQLGLPEAPAKSKPGSAAPPIELGTPLEVETQATVHLPRGTSVRPPTGTSVQRDYATFVSEYSVKGETITASRHIHFLLKEIPADRAADYNAFLRAVQNDEAQDFTLERETVATPGVKPGAGDPATAPKPPTL